MNYKPNADTNDTLESQAEVIKSIGKGKAPAFQYYPRDTLANPEIAAMNNEEFGAYWRLISYIWLEGFLSFDEKKLSRLLKISPKKFRRLWLAMEKLFLFDDNKITSPELDEIRIKQREWREKSAEGGRKSGEVRRKGGSKMVQPNMNTAFSSSTSSSSSKIDLPPKLDFEKQKSNFVSPPKRGSNKQENDGTRIDPNFQLSKEDITWINEHYEGFSANDINTAREVFIDHWLGVPGKHGLKRDWSAAFRNHFRKYAERY